MSNAPLPKYSHGYAVVNWLYENVRDAKGNPFIPTNEQFLQIVYALAYEPGEQR